MNWTTIALMLARHALSGGSGAAILDAFVNGDWKTGIAGALGLVISLLGAYKNKTNAVAASGQVIKGL